jgi:hypothetical protein
MVNGTTRLIQNAAPSEAVVYAQALSNVLAIAAAARHSLALKNDGTVVGWGDNTFGQTNAPSGLANVVAIAARAGRSMAITVDLRIASIERLGSDAVLRFRGFAGWQYAVEFSPDLIPGSWVDLPGGSFGGTGLDATITDTNAVTGAESRFYRVRESQTP